jgi:hypothetical protein
VGSLRTGIAGGSIRSVAVTKLQRNDLFRMLGVKRVDPADCDFDTSGDGVRIVHPLTRSWFGIDPFENPHGSIMIQRRVPDGMDGRPRVVPCKGWNQVLIQLSYWADEIRVVVETPDLWEELRSAPDVLTAAQQGEIGDTPFTPDEQVEISRKLDAVKQLVREKFELSNDQLAVIDQRLDVAEEAAKHTDRKTWLYTFYGAVMSTFMTDAVPPGVIQTVLSTVSHGIAHIFGIGGPPPIIGP